MASARNRILWLGFWVFLVTGMVPLLAADLNGLNEARGVNLTLEEGFGARQSGMGISFAGFQTGADAVANAPASMGDVNDFTFATSHAEKFGEAKFDDAAVLIPFESNSTLGVGLSRYGISGVDLRPEGSSQLQSQAPEVFSVADYVVIAAFARRWGAWDFGFDFNLLYRQLDQDGIGMRGDGMVQYTMDDWLRLGALVKGLIPSSASWQSGYMEYEPTDIHLAIAGRFPSPYFYGTLQVAAQTAGLFQEQAKSSNSLKSSQLISDPGDILSTTNLGAEFFFDFGLGVRFGLSELAFSKSISGLATFGIGYKWKGIVGMDYSFTPHPDLLASHRISIEWTPAFPKFTGVGFRNKAASPQSAHPFMPSPATPASDAGAAATAGPAGASDTGAAPKESAAPAANKSEPNGPPPEKNPSPDSSKAEKTAPSTPSSQKSGAEKEILEKDEE